MDALAIVVKAPEESDRTAAGNHHRPAERATSLAGALGEPWWTLGHPRRRNVRGARLAREESPGMELACANPPFNLDARVGRRLSVCFKC
jgi:hypothetical protein